MRGSVGTFIRWLGASFLVLCAAICIPLIVAIRQNPSPVIAPLSLKQGTMITTTFRTDIAHEYEIALRVDKKSAEKLAGVNRAPMGKFPMGEASFERAACLFGTDNSHNICDGIKSIIDMSWSISEGSTTIAQGRSSSEYGIEALGDKLLGDVGEFKGEKGHSYTLTLRVNRDASELSGADPELVVHIPYSYLVDLAANNAVLELGAALSGLIGFGLLYPTMRARVLRLFTPLSASSRSKL
jgi:hypothetical protein